MSLREHQWEDFSLQKLMLAHELLQMVPLRTPLFGQHGVMPNELEDTIRDAIVPYCN